MARGKKAKQVETPPKSDSPILSDSEETQEASPVPNPSARPLPRCRSVLVVVDDPFLIKAHPEALASKMLPLQAHFLFFVVIYLVICITLIYVTLCTPRMQ